MVGSKDVILYGLIGAVFHKRNVFVGRSMKYNIRMIPFKNLINSSFVSNCSNLHVHIYLKPIISSQFLLYIIYVIFINVQNNQQVRITGCYLAAQLTSNRSTAAGNEYRFIS